MSTRGRLDLPGRSPLAGPLAPTVAPAPARRGRTAVVAVAAAVVVVLALTAIAFYAVGSRTSNAAPPKAVPSSAAPSRDPTTAEIYTAVAPSVVTIAADHLAAKTVELGTGVVVRADGTILTARHVVAGADAIRVTFADGTASTATVTAENPAIDIATLGPTTLPSVVVPAALGNSARLAVGDNVVAVGNPFGLTRTTTAGVVSGLDRAATDSEGGVNLTGLIQFDAAVNPGNSGGPLLNGRGETVGIVVALANPTQSRTFIGIGFAVPIGTAVATGGGDRVPQQ